jgi:hypothetical protein
LTEETSDDAATGGGILADIAALARMLAETEPCKSASGPEALRALAARLDEMVAPPRRTEPAVIQVAVSRKAAVSRKKAAR